MTLIDMIRPAIERVEIKLKVHSFRAAQALGAEQIHQSDVGFLNLLWPQRQKLGERLGLYDGFRLGRVLGFRNSPVGNLVVRERDARTEQERKKRREE